ncbi:Uncharacterised protein [Sphingobacterium daejeonense]|nr:Uncharacterised protein [Sphingobacterium daejeonense]
MAILTPIGGTFWVKWESWCVGSNNSFDLPVGTGALPIF